MAVELTEHVQEFLKAIASQTRQSLVFLLADGQEKTVSELANASGLRVSTTSTHLATLRRAHVVTARRAGKEVWYSADADGIRSAITDLSGFLEYCCPAPDAAGTSAGGNESSTAPRRAD